MSSNYNRELPALSTAEHQLMDIIWSSEKASVREVHETLTKTSDKAVKRTTIQVQLERLQKKGWLAVDDSRRPFLYSPTRERHVAHREVATSVLQNVFRGSFSSLVRCLIEKENISPEELDEIKAMIKAKEEES